MTYGMPRFVILNMTVILMVSSMANPPAMFDGNIHLAINYRQENRQLRLYKLKVSPTNFYFLNNKQEIVFQFDIFNTAVRKILKAFTLKNLKMLFIVHKIVLIQANV